MKNWKRKIAAGVLATGMVLGSATAAVASPPPQDDFPFKIYFDSFPAPSGSGFYYSSGSAGNTGARVTQSRSDWGIRYTERNGDIYVTAALSDTAADGSGPTLKIETYADERTGRDYRVTELRNLDGNGTTRVRSATIDYSTQDISEYTAVYLTVCNGKSASGGNQQCGARHGAFHTY